MGNPKIPLYQCHLYVTAYSLIFVIYSFISYFNKLFDFSILANLQIPSKKWNLEDDSDEEDESKNNAEKVIEEEEIDPLDAFMQVII